MADAGVASRRACEEMIQGGLVTVNGEIVREMPVLVDPDEDRIVVDGLALPKRDPRIYIMLNKPSRTVTTNADEPGANRRTVIDLVEHPAAKRLFPVGRLDFETLGLLLLTNDGELANRLTHPSYGVAKTYRVVVRGQLADEDIASLEEGIYLAERKEGKTVGAARTARVQLEIVKRDRDRTTLHLTLKEGRNRQVRRMLAGVGYPVKKLERIAMGPLRLKGLARGEWRELTRDEVRVLRDATRPGKKGAGKGTTSAERGAGSKSERSVGGSGRSGQGSGGRTAAPGRAGATPKRRRPARDR
ncbi:MAG: rRNA pseudouridine synthase [Phycisphaerales bacterium]|nr:MAG: rRNA pseudouridine synthase [Phycisphaerales bacterium]